MGRPRARGAVAVESSVSGDVFERFVQDPLVPRLQPGDVVVWDNHSVHKRPALREMIRARGAELVWQPRYSPEVNAAEPLWSRTKHLVRRPRADTAAALGEALAEAVAALTWEDSAGWLRHCGYRISPAA